MGYRKNKFFGWGVEVRGDDFTEDFKNAYLEYNNLNAFDSADYSYDRFFDFLEALPKTEELEFILSNKNYLLQSEKLPKLKDFLLVKAEPYDSDEDGLSFEETTFFINIAPHIVSNPDLARLSLKEALSKDENHLEAEFDLLNPESLFTMSSFSKTVRIPPSMSSYQVRDVSNLNNNSTQDEVSFNDLSEIEKDFIRGDLHKALYKDIKSDESYMFNLVNDVESKSILSKINSVDDLLKRYYLGAPTDVVELCKFFNIFKDSKTALKLQPMVTYFYN